jgi:hypothetical protein
MALDGLLGPHPAMEEQSAPIWHQTQNPNFKILFLKMKMN